ncbi:anti-sigma factor family protein [Paenibacillus sp. GCM10012307]|uniref:Anti-sigma-W factor RsiW n=1 Tax=Paenibacillus roseus TaxID=2798579 RepID=A0A934J1I4_9BACL|nr:anti-sigma factor [Paenibacillus roseus]MBJ6363077.1 zf-HC2 domain-containing protein [Paenibacillus roseus]
MTCQEVMDYMQRQLDGDLDERETEILMSHLKDCPDCAEMQKRLSLLSSELENLPKVAPPYSLVDAIMPRLEQIELQRQEPEESVLPRRKTPDRSGRSWFQRYRALSGVIAAGLVAGIFMLTYNPQNLPTASENSNAAGNAAGVADSSLQSNSIASDTNQAQNGEQQETMASDEPTKNFNTDAAEQGAGVESAETGASAPATEPQARSFKGDSNQESLSKKQVTRVTASSPDGAASNSSGGHEQNSKAEKDGNGSHSPSYSGQIGGSKDEASNRNSQEAPDMGFVPPENVDADIFSDQKALAGIAQVQQAVSPDSRYSAVVTDQSVSIYSTDSNELLFRGGEREGVISNLLWSDDNLTLGYDVKDSHGNVSHYVIHVKDGTEAKQ